jgi:hypothetical protein
MQSASTVDRKQGRRWVVVSTKLPPDEAHLLEAARERTGDTFISETVRRAIRSELERVFPGSVRAA